MRHRFVLADEVDASAPKRKDAPIIPMGSGANSGSDTWTASPPLLG